MKNSLPYTVVYDDEKILAVNKSSGISVGGERWEESKQRLDKLLERDFKLSKIFTVHRIDKETSGLIVFAKKRETHRSLSQAFEQRKVLKTYIAIVHGRPLWKETSCDLALVPNGNKKHMTIIDKFRGKESLTNFICLFSTGNYSVLQVHPQTGRIHQIRVHSAALGFPVTGDTLYGTGKSVYLSAVKKKWHGDPLDEKPLLSRLGLHAMDLSFSLNTNDDTSVFFHAPLPRDMAALVRQMRKVSSPIIPA